MWLKVFTMDAASVTNAIILMGWTTRGAFQRKNLINPGNQYGP
jgi:hypothetical protein